MKRRNTIQKGIILQTIQKMENHPTAIEIYQEVIKENCHISKGTLYRNLAVLTSEGIIVKVNSFDGADHYDHINRTHQHGKCNKCQRIFDVFLKDFDLEEYVKQSEMELTGYSLLFTGICEKCKKEELHG